MNFREMEKSQLLKHYILSDETLIVPDAFDPLSARLIEMAGFKAVQCSGMSFSISSCYKNEVNYSLQENLEMTRKIVNVVDIPVMADGEDGFGEPEDVYKTTCAFLKIGASGINLEDQVLSGSNEGGVVDIKAMCQKVKAARQAAVDLGDRDFIINARTDVVNSISDRKTAIDLAIKRANAYLEHGADMAFVTHVSKRDELVRLARYIEGPISISAGTPFSNPEYTIQDCRDLKINRVSLPTALIFAAIQGMKNVLEGLKSSGDLGKSLEQRSFCSVQDLKGILKL